MLTPHPGRLEEGPPVAAMIDCSPPLVNRSDGVRTHGCDCGLWIAAVRGRSSSPAPSISRVVVAGDVQATTHPSDANTHTRCRARRDIVVRFAEVIRLAEGMHYAYWRALAYHATSQVQFLKGDWAKAHELIDRQIEVLRTASIADDLPHALAYSARCLAHLGDASEALSRLRAGERLLAEQAAGRKTGTGYIYVLLGRACLDLGLVDEAQRLAERAAAPALTRVDFVPYCLKLLGDITIHPDRFDAERAEAHYRAALALAEPRAMRPLVAHCQLGLGTLYGRIGKAEQAHENLVAAATMFRDMDMRFWLAQADSELHTLA